MRATLMSLLAALLVFSGAAVAQQQPEAAEIPMTGSSGLDAAQDAAAAAEETAPATDAAAEPGEEATGESEVATGVEEEEEEETEPTEAPLPEESALPPGEGAIEGAMPPQEDAAAETGEQPAEEPIEGAGALPEEEGAAEAPADESAQLDQPAEEPATETAEVVTQEGDTVTSGKLDQHLFGMGDPDLMATDGTVYQLVGPLAETIEDLRDQDGKLLEVMGTIAREEGASPKLHVKAFRLAGASGAIGESTEWRTSPSFTLRGKVDKKLFGNPELIASDGARYRIVGPQVETLEALEAVEQSEIEATGQLILDGETKHLNLMAFRRLEEPKDAEEGRIETGLGAPPEGEATGTEDATAEEEPAAEEEASTEEAPISDIETPAPEALPAPGGTPEDLSAGQEDIGAEDAAAEQEPSMDSASGEQLPAEGESEEEKESSNY